MIKIILSFLKLFLPEISMRIFEKKVYIINYDIERTVENADF